MKRILALLLCAVSLFAAGTVQQTTQQISTQPLVYVVSLYWTGDPITGSVPATTVQGLAPLQGYRVVSMEAVPGATAPTSGYSITLNDTAGVDVLAGAAASLSNTAPQAFSGSPTAPPIFGTFTVKVTGNSVASANGTILVYLSPISQIMGLSPSAPSFPSQGADLFYASPCGSSGSPGFRGLCASDFGSFAIPINAGGTGQTTQSAALTALLGSSQVPAANGGTGAASPTAHTVPVAQGASPFNFVGPGTSGQVFTSNGSGNDPSWQTPATSPTLPMVSSETYNFSPQTPGGTLSTGSNTVTLTPCPLGIATSGSFASEMYISGGTGTAEPVRLTGGSCTSGASSGTVIFTAANNHSGAWTIQSATAGIDLACSSSASGVHVLIPPGAYNIYGTIRPPGNCTIDGQLTPTANGPNGGTALQMQTAGIPMFDFATYGITVENLSLTYGTYPSFHVGGVAATSGSIAIQSAVTAGVDSSGNSPYVYNVAAFGFYNSYIINGDYISFFQVSSFNAVQDGFVQSQGGDGHMIHVISEYSGGNGFTLTAGAAFHWMDVEGFNNGGWCIETKNGVAFQMDSVDCEQDYSGEIYVSAQPASFSASMQDVFLQSAGSTVTHGTNSTAPCLQLFSGTAFMSFSNVLISGCQGYGVNAASNFTTFNNIQVFESGQGGTNLFGINAAGSNLTFTNTLTFGVENQFNGPGQSITASQFLGNVNSSPLVVIGASASGNVFCNNFVSNGGTSPQSISYSSGASGTQCSNYASPAPTGTLKNVGFPSVGAQVFSNLASCTSALEGTSQPVTDSTTNTWGATITGSGSDHVLAYCNGTNWTVAAK